MENVTEDNAPKSRLEVFLFELEKIAEADTEIDPVMSILGRFAVGAIINEHTYGVSEDEELFTMTEAVRSRLYDASVPEKARENLRGMFYLLVDAAHTVPARLNEMQKTVLDSLDDEVMDRATLGSKFSPDALRELELLQRSKVVIIRRFGEGEDMRFAFSTTPRGRAAMDAYDMRVRRDSKDK